MAETLRDLGVVVDHPEPNVYEVAAGDVDWLFVPLEAAAKMRASFMLLGPLLARFGEVIISNPGGDRIGRRPVDLHVDAMRALGAEIDYRYGYYYAKAPGRLRGAEVRFPFVSVMGTENAMLAATLADGHTVIRPAAQEPEIDDLIDFLCKMGAEVERTVPGHDRDRGPEAPPRRRTTRWSRTGSRPARSSIAAAVTGGHVTPRAGPLRPPRRPRRDPRPDGGRRRLRHGPARRGRHGRRPGRLHARRHRDRAVPGPRDRPPAADERPADPGQRPVDRPRDDLRGPPRVDDRAPPDGRRDRPPGRPPRDHPGPGPAPRRRRRDLRPAGRRLAHPGRAGRRRERRRSTARHHVRRGYENIERKFLDLGARFEHVLEEEPVTPA